MLKQLNREISTTLKFSVAELQKSTRDGSHCSSFVLYELEIVVFYVCVVSHVIKSLYIVFAPNKYVSLYFTSLIYVFN